MQTANDTRNSPRRSQSDHGHAEESADQRPRRRRAQPTVGKIAEATERGRRAGKFELRRADPTRNGGEVSDERRRDVAETTAIELMSQPAPARSAMRVMVAQPAATPAAQRGQIGVAQPLKRSEWSSGSE
ncbi:hypothetical protein Syun_025218 [Stephania yunnanensis]|uniref:Uncharacterized protein n=1 Tax=Stephania yunnanensis TaxID=152371 RepID=A0AAP0HR15_9MAGN